MPWLQVYDPTGSAALSTLLAALPIVVLLGALGLLGWPAPRAAFAGLATALGVAIVAYGMPWRLALAAAGYGAAVGLFPIGWIVLGAIFLYSLTVETGEFEKVKWSVASLSPDRRIQALLIAFSFGAFLEGAAGFGTPVAISAALMIGAGFKPLHAAGLALIANTAPVAFGALGTPIHTLADVTKLPEMQLSQMAGRQLPLFSLIIPAWMVVAMSGWKGLRGVWPAVAVSGASFALVQFVISNFLGPTLVDVGGGLVSLVLLTLFLRVWQPAEVWHFEDEIAGTASTAPLLRRDTESVRYSTETRGAKAVAAAPRFTRRQVASAWVPWIILSVCVCMWGLPPIQAWLDGGRTLRPAAASSPAEAKRELTWWERPNSLVGRTLFKFSVPYLDGGILRGEGVTAEPGKPEEAVYKLNWLSATGTGIFSAVVLSSLWMRVSLRRFMKVFAATLVRMRWPLFTIAAMLAIAYTTRYGGTDVTLGLAFTKTGFLYPFFAAMLGWLGVALTGSDTSSNALFGSLQKITAEGLGLNPVLICAANSTGGVMGKMIDAQSIVVSAVATNQPGGESQILRYVFWHSVILASLMGLLTLLQATVLTWMVPGRVDRGEAKRTDAVASPVLMSSNAVAEALLLSTNHRDEARGITSWLARALPRAEQYATEGLTLHNTTVEFAGGARYSTLMGYDGTVTIPPTESEGVNAYSNYPGANSAAMAIAYTDWAVDGEYDDINAWLGVYAAKRNKGDDDEDCFCREERV